MKIFAVLVIFTLHTAVALSSASASSVSNCTWQALKQERRDYILTEYERSMERGAAALTAQDTEIMAASAKCAGRDDIPPPLLKAAIGSFAIQAGMAQALTRQWGIGRETLEHYWTQAPEAARNCFLSNSAKVFGVEGPNCTDAKAILWFPQALDIPVTQDVSGPAGQVLIFYNAKAQNSLAEEMLGRLITG
ncbi:hypothetical protein [Geminicoccus harenae]|uniref:hypothetical protein n=1 Tax=Geminicoccus harenae TaxID=2498453 RepID=UPI00168BA04D|nr:hypothetical protein [Geminicoccus harenae]